MSGRRLKMKDLERATGVGRETIRFYIREGLLPQPERPGRNVAWYGESFVERIAVIKELQRQRYLPLHAIKALLGGDTPPTRAEVDALLAIEGKLFRGVPGPAAARLSEVAHRTGLKAAEIRHLAAVEAIAITTRDGDQWLEGDALRFVEVWAEFRRAGYSESLGFGPEKLRVYVDFVRWLGREELRLFTQGVAGRVDAETTARMAERGIDIVGQMLVLLRKATLLRFIAEGNVPQDETSLAPPDAVAPRRR
jgi:DNA-binding transcriptional MerR regulator